MYSYLKRETFQELNLLSSPINWLLFVFPKLVTKIGMEPIIIKYYPYLTYAPTGFDANRCY